MRSTNIFYGGWIYTIRGWFYTCKNAMSIIAKVIIDITFGGIALLWDLE